MSSTCAECKQCLGITCCELPIGETPTFGVTLPEVNRIIRHTDEKVSKCFTVEELTWEEYQEFVRKSDIFSQIFAGQARIRLNVVSEPGASTSACVFLKKGEGCSLSVDVRPHICLLYPFWFERKLHKGDETDTTSLTVVNGLFPGMCYGKILSKARNFASEGQALLDLFNTNEAELLDVARKLLRDAHVHARLLKSPPVALALK
jgi:Fe-S-cluster containining protein